jgi:hypothetical protein
MIDCLENFIGVRGLCTEDPPTSGLYINDLPGIQTSMLEMFSSSENDSFESVWNKVYNRTIDNFLADVINMMPVDMKASQILEDVSVGQSKDDKTAITTSNEYRGVYIYASGSTYLKGIVSAVSYYAETGGSVTFKVFDAQDGTELSSKTKTLVAGWNQIVINTSANARGDRLSLFVCYDGNGLDTQETSDTVFRGDAESFSQAYGAKVAIGTTPIEDNLTNEGETYGIVVHYQMICAVDQFVCRNAHRLATAIRIKAGIELLMEVIMNSEQFNRYNAQDIEILKEKVMMFEDQYEAAMKVALLHSEPVRDRTCFKCQQSIRYQSTLPG